MKLIRLHIFHFARPLAFSRSPFALFLAAVCLAQISAMALAPTQLMDSIKPVSTNQSGAPADPRVARITRTALKDSENAAPMPVEFNLKMRNLAELEARLARGERISQGEMAVRYEPLTSNYEALAAWVAGQGLTITQRDSHHMALFAHGKVAEVSRALGLRFARVAFEGKEYTSAITAPVVPGELSPLLVGINGLQPHLHAHPHILHRAASPDAASGSAEYFPSQIADAYDATALYNNNVAGSGESIAIVIDTFPAPSDLITFWKDAGVNQSIGNIQFIQAVEGTLPAPSGEETLDVEWSSSMAPSANVRVYAATDLEDNDLDSSYQRVYDDVTAHPEYGIHQMSMSYGQGERSTTRSQVETDDQFFAELAAAGVTVFASSGDDGSTPGSGGTGDETGAVQVESPASDPNVTGVGGTSLVLTSSNTVSSESVWDRSTNGASGGGVSIYFAKPSWQTGQGVVSGTGREVPDVAASADPDFGAVIVEGGTKQVVGGTSWSSPTWAGICALLNQARANAGQSTLGILGPHIYPQLNATNFPGAYSDNFRDITAGSNATAASNGKYSATVGYDLCTGVGVPLSGALAQLVIGTSQLVGIQAPQLVDEVAPGTDGTFAVTVSGASATYQWQRMPLESTTWTSLGNTDTTYIGASSAALTIANTTTDMSGDQFRCLVTSGANTNTTRASALVVDSPLSISTLAGKAGTTGLTNGASTVARFQYPSGIAVDASGNSYVADFSNNVIRKVTSNGTVSTPYGNTSGNSGSANGSGNTATFNTPNDVVIDGSNNLYVADTGNNSIRKIDAGVVSTFATGFDVPEGLAVDSSGNVYVADSGNNIIRKITGNGSVSTFAGRIGTAGFADGASTTKALFNDPADVAVDALGNVYVSDFGNSVIRKISNGTVTTVAGMANVSGYLDGSGTAALFNAPTGLCIDAANNLYIADTQVPASGSVASGNCVVRKLSAANVVSTLAGNAGIEGSINGVGSAAEFYSVQGVAVDGSNRFYLADTYNQLIRTGTTGAAAPESSSAIISLSGNMAFGTVLIGGTATSILTIANSGNAPLAITGVSYPSGYSGDFSAGTINSGSSQSVKVTFTPTAAQNYAGNIVVSSNAAGGSDSIAVSGSGSSGITPPVVTTGSASAQGDSLATLYGSANPEGSLTNVYFVYGTSALTSTTAQVNVGSGDTNVDFSSVITGLQPLMTYQYRAVAVSSNTVVLGNIGTFTTGAFSTAAMATTDSVAAGLPGATYRVVGNPAINASGYLAFKSSLTIGLGGVTAATDFGVWAQSSSGNLNLIAQQGGAAPGTSLKFATFSNPVYNNNDAVAFGAGLAGSISTLTAEGLWTNSSGALALVARRGTQAPGYPGGVVFTNFSKIALPDTGSLFIFGSVSAAKNNIAIWTGSSVANLQLVIKEGQTFNSKTITGLSILPTLSIVNGQTRDFVQSGGVLACQAAFGPSSSALLEINGTTPQAIAMSGSAAAGLPGAEYAAFGNPAINANADVAFRATLVTGAGGVTSTDNQGIWADDNAGTLQLVALTGSDAPGTAGSFAKLNDPVYNANEAVAFVAALKIATGQATATTASGIWTNTSGVIELVVRQGSQAPGCPAGVTFAAFSRIALPDQGGVIFAGQLNGNAATGVNASNDTGIWAVDTSGTLRLIIRKGQSLDGKKVTTLSFLPLLTLPGGQTRNFVQGTGNLVYQAGFVGGSSGIFSVTFP